WAPAEGASPEAGFATLAEWRAAVPWVEANGRQHVAGPGAVFMSPELKNLRLHRPLTVVPSTPPEILQLIGWTEAEGTTPGAYPAGR
ncbi:MAG: hypothetical protein R6W68_16865, partial [Ignavibacteriaceae bacterium]